LKELRADQRDEAKQLKEETETMNARDNAPAMPAIDGAINAAHGLLLKSEDALSADDVAKALAIKKAEASKQLRELHGLGLLENEPRKGGTMYFRLAVAAPVSDINEMGDVSLTNEDKTDTPIDWTAPEMQHLAPEDYELPPADPALLASANRMLSDRLERVAHVLRGCGLPALAESFGEATNATNTASEAAADAATNIKQLSADEERLANNAAKLAEAQRQHSAAMEEAAAKAASSIDTVATAQAKLLEIERQIGDAIAGGESQQKIQALITQQLALRASIEATKPPVADLGKEFEKTGDKGKQAFDGTSQSASRAASEIQATGEAAQQSATMAAEGTASLSGVVAALFSKYSALSEAAGKFFAESLKNANFGSSSFESYGKAIEAADRATQQAYDNQIAGSQALIARLKEFAQAGTLAGASAADAFQYSESSLTSLLSAVEEGRSGFELLDRQSLSNLQSAIDAARNKTRQLADEAAAAADQLNALGDQLEEQALRDAGNEEEIARRAYDARLKQIEDLAAKSGQAGMQAAERARALAQDEYNRKLAQIEAEKQAEIRAARESADARIAENARVFNNDPSRTSASGARGGGAISTAPIDARSNSGLNATRDGDSISINMNFDKGADIFQSRAVKEEVARIVAKELERLARRKR